MTLDAKKLSAQIEKTGVISFVPKGNSMWPIIKGAKQSVIIEKKQDRLSPLDVALYSRQDGTAVLHRVIEVKEDGYVTCGDGQVNQEFVLEENVFGVMQSLVSKKKIVAVTDEEYIKKVEKWYSNPKRRIRKIKTFQRLQKIKRIFCKK